MARLEQDNTDEVPMQGFPLWKKRAVLLQFWRQKVKEVRLTTRTLTLGCLASILGAGTVGVGGSLYGLFPGDPPIADTIDNHTPLTRSFDIDFMAIQYAQYFEGREAYLKRLEGQIDYCKEIGDDPYENIKRAQENTLRASKNLSGARIISDQVKGVTEAIERSDLTVEQKEEIRKYLEAILKESKAIEFSEQATGGTTPPTLNEDELRTFLLIARVGRELKVHDHMKRIDVSIQAMNTNGIDDDTFLTLMNSLNTSWADYRNAHIDYLNHLEDELIWSSVISRR